MSFLARALGLGQKGPARSGVEKSAVEERIKTRDEELRGIVAKKIEGDAIQKIERAGELGDHSIKEEGEEMLETARAVRSGEASLLDALGIPTRDQP